ncbi:MULTISPECIES: twin-arginine translocation signal domain-containing protein [Haloarcula]|uniref:Twin-arginine translocation signal domain-containing protein n=1 Tax=Haloarcula salinisoli TaxID=2487746 RepID=A0A8J7YHC1_9EURY|nr:twin-arginine translocation signal domain-containing protein [Halomicroarcula salinisoli]MBX0305527.1 twin-arginine translocation signal domain-containing protein [Halomicroarcula salinisoli]
MPKRQTTPDPKQLTESTPTRRWLLKGAAGVAAGTAFGPATSGPLPDRTRY